MTRLFLIRHGENIDGQVDGQGPTVDLGLSDRGRDQVARLCARLSADASLKPTALFSSPLPRAAETAEALSAALGLAATFDRRLEEWRSDDGTITPEAFMAQWRALPERDRAYHRVQPQSETQAEFSARAGQALHSLTRENANGSLLVVTHGGFIQSAFRHFFGFGDAAFRRAYPAAGHTSLTLWCEDAAMGRWVLEYSNDVTHLGDVV